MNDEEIINQYGYYLIDDIKQAKILMQKARADERQKIIDSLTYDNFRNFGFSVSAILQLYDEDDGTSVIVEILEELKKQLAQSEDKT